MTALAALRLHPAPEPATFAAPALRRPAARRIRDDAEALAVAEVLAVDIARDAMRRDRERILPYAELDQLSDAGLLAITVPRAFGGAGVSAGTVARAIALLSGADASIGQIPQNHFFMLEALRLQGTPEQQGFFYGRILAGERIGNAIAEAGTRTANEHRTRLTPEGAGYRLDGTKFYCTGALFADWVAPVAKDEADASAIVFLPRDTAGLAITDDWAGFGQRVTGSGTTVLEGVAVDRFQVVPLKPVFDRPTVMGPFAQIMHAAVEQGIAEAALAETVRFVREVARPWGESEFQRAQDDTYLIAAMGELKIRVDASAALLERAGPLVDRAADRPSEETVAEASIAVAEAKVASTETALYVSSKLIELGGASATQLKYGLDRFWRNARTHTVHDPVRWKYHAIGNYWLNGIAPPRHGAI